MDPSLSEVTAVVGEPFKIRVPFKGSPVPIATWFNVRSTFVSLTLYYEDMFGFFGTVFFQQISELLIYIARKQKNATEIYEKIKAVDEIIN